jgi:hypothetical protein
MPLLCYFSERQDTMIAKYKEFFLGVGITILAVVYGIAATQIKTRVATTIGPQYVPYGLAAICFVLGTAQMIMGWSRARRYEKEAHPPENKDGRAGLLVFLALAAYVAALRTAGFLIATTVLCFVLQILLCPQGQAALSPVRRGGGDLHSGHLFTCSANGLHLMLPAGILKFP